MLRIGTNQTLAAKGQQSFAALLRRQLSSSSAASSIRGSVDDLDDGNFRGQDEWRAARQAVLQAIGEDEDNRQDMAYSLAMSGTRDSMFPTFNLSMKRQIQNSEDQLRWSTVSSTIRQHSTPPLPRTLKEATRPHAKEAIVVTDVRAPFKIVNVNKAWEGLCEYTAAESCGESLGPLLQGEETDPLAVTALMSALLRGEDAGTILTNYTKSGRKFRNRLRVGPIRDEEGKLTHFVGILQEETSSAAGNKPIVSSA